MSSFTQPLVLEDLGNGTWRTTREFIYYVGEEGKGEAIVVPQGFVTDLASVPRMLWPLVPPMGKFNQAAVLHDYLYSIGCKTRKACDDVFLEAMAVLGVRWSQRWTIYSGVRIGGWVAWNNHRRREGQDVRGV